MKKRTKNEIKRCLTGIVTASLIISNVHIGTFALAAKKTSIAKSAKVTVGKTVMVKLKNMRLQFYEMRHKKRFGMQNHTS